MHHQVKQCHPRKVLSWTHYNYHKSTSAAVSPAMTSRKEGIPQRHVPSADITSANRRSSSVSYKPYYSVYVPGILCHLALLPCRCSMRWHCRTDISHVARCYYIWESILTINFFWLFVRSPSR